MSRLGETLGRWFGGAPDKKGGAGKTPAKKTPSKKVTAPKAGDSDTVREQALAQIRAVQDKVVTADRAELIRQAMQIRKAKQQILADLSDEQRAKLAALAIRGLLNEGRDEPKS